MLKINISDFCMGIITMFMLLIYLLSYNNNWSTFALALVIFETALIIMNSKFSVFSIFSTAVVFCVIQSYIKFIGGNIPGILGLNIAKNHFWFLCNVTFYFQFIMYLYIYFTDILNLEKNVYKKSLDYKYNGTCLFFLLSFALIITFLIFPSIPNFRLDINRHTYGYLNFRGFEIVPFVFLMMTLGCIKENKWLIGFYFVIIFWYISHGERVVALGFIFCMMFLYVYTNKKINISKYIKYIIILLAVVTLFSWIGLYRKNGNTIDFEDLIGSVLIQSTACDVTHTFNCAVEIFKHEPLKHGLTYLAYIYEMIPTLKDPYTTDIVLKESYATSGGSLLFNEPLINFGYAGIALYPFILMFIFHLILKQKKNRYWCFVWNIIVITSFRLMWYGLNYPITAILWIIPISLFFFGLLNKPLNNGKAKKL